MNENAQDRFIQLMDVCQDRIKNIQIQVTNHLGKSPDLIDYADVGDAMRLVEDLEIIAAYLTGVEL